MSTNANSDIPRDLMARYLVALADDELVLGHRDSEWTGHGPILEEDIAFSNIAQDELGHALALFTIAAELGGMSPDTMAFGRPWQDFRCCRFVEYPKGDFAYTVVRQFFFDAAEQVRMKSHEQSSFEPLRDVSAKILAEEGYHLMHSRGLFERLGDSTDESRRRMQEAVSLAFPQALGLFEEMDGEQDLVRAGAVSASRVLQHAWLNDVVPVVSGVGLAAPVRKGSEGYMLDCSPEEGGRKGNHTAELALLVQDLQQVYQSVPGAKW